MPGACNMERWLAKADATCHQCGAPLWPTLTEAQRQEAVAGAEAMYQEFGRRWRSVWVCEACKAKADADQRTWDIERALMLETMTMCNLQPYGDIWPVVAERNPQAAAIARHWRPHYGSVFLCGPEGVGKTALARHMLYRTVAEFGGRVAEVLSVWYTRLECHARISEANHARVLLLDDVSTVEMTTKGLTRLWETLNIRASRKTPTLVTSNMRPEALVQAWRAVHQQNQQLPSSILRRLYPVKVIEMRGESIRKEMTYGE